jgi:hypothetical protein
MAQSLAKKCGKHVESLVADLFNYVDLGGCRRSPNHPGQQCRNGTRDSANKSCRDHFPQLKRA